MKIYMAGFSLTKEREERILKAIKSRLLSHWYIGDSSPMFSKNEKEGFLVVVKKNKGEV